MRRITPRTCLWPLVWCLSATFALSIGLTFQSDKHCFAGVCGEWLFPFQARLHVVVWYLWLSLSVSILGLRAFQPRIRNLVATPLGLRVPLLGKQLRVGGVLLVFWVCALYGILISIWWRRLSQYFEQRGGDLPGNNIVAAIALTGHLADVTMGMVLLPVSRHSALTSFFKLSPSTTCTFHITQAHVLFGLVIIHGSLYAYWASLYNQARGLYRPTFPVLNPTYLYNEVWPGNHSSLGIWRASLIFTGIASSLIMLAMFLTSFPVIRRARFNLFYFTHLLGIVAVIVICLHASTMFYCTIPGLSMWLLDWGMRIAELRSKMNGRLRALGNGWFMLVLPLPRNRLSGCACHSPLAHFYIHHSQSSIREIHPFTTITHLATQKVITSETECAQIDVQFLFRQSVIRDSKQLLQQPIARKNMQWTNRLAALVDEESGVQERKDSIFALKSDSSAQLHQSQDVAVDELGVETSLRLEGPYFTSANPEMYKTVICLVAGTGLSGALAIAAAFKARREAACLRVDMSNPTWEQKNNVCLVVPGQGMHWQRCVIIWSVREKDYTRIPFVDDVACDGLEFRVHKTGGTNARLDPSAALADICGVDGHDTWVYISGPNGFISGVSRACLQMKGLAWFEARWD